MSSFDSGFGILRNFEILYFWTNLTDIWLRGQILGLSFKSEAIFHIRGHYQADTGHILTFWQ